MHISSILSKRGTFFLAACLCLSGIAVAGVPNDPAKFDLYLLAGQSNMSGRGVVEEADRQPDPQVYVLNSKNEWICQGEPIHFDKPAAGVGLGFTFAKLMAARKPGATIGLIPCAVGGSSIDKWKPGGPLFQKAVERAQIAVKNGQLKGILWHQGEASDGDRNLAEAYGADLAEVVAGFRKALGMPNLPFVAGELGEYRYTHGGEPSFAPIVNEQIKELPKKVPFTAVVSSKGLKDKGDGRHFDSPSLREFGKRYSEAFLALAGSSK